MASFSTEVTSSKILSDNPLYQRTSKAYHLVKNYAGGNTLEIGCGEGYGIPIYINQIDKLTLVDKSKSNIKTLKATYPHCDVFVKTIPPLPFLKSNSFDSIISFQVIEHLKHHDLFIQEIFRLLKPGGKAFITTPNKEKTIARNPWHHKEFDYDEINHLIKKYFSDVKIKGIEGNATTDQYYKKNAKSVKRILSYDVLQLEQKLPNSLLRLPYEILNRINRNKLLKSNMALVHKITLDDYSLNDYNLNTLDFFCMLTKEKN